MPLSTQLLLLLLALCAVSAAAATADPRPPRYRNDLTVLAPDAAGIDVGADFHMVAVPPDEHGHVEVRRFGACTADLHALADWLTAHRVTTVALESTGVYWIPLYDLLEQRGFAVFLVDPRQTRRTAGRPKSDHADAQWIRRLHSIGLLTAAFRPPQQIRALRCYARHKANLVRLNASHVQHIQKALEQMNVKLTEAVSDITGKTGMGIIRAILAGARDPKELAKLRDHRCKQDEGQLARALTGTWRDEHLFELAQAVAQYDFTCAQISQTDAAIEEQLQRLQLAGVGELPPPRAGKRKLRRKKGNALDNAVPTEARRASLFGCSGADLTQIEGIGEETALVVLSEVGSDLGRFPTSKQFCAWLGLCPQVQKSGGKVLASRVRPGRNRAAQALRLAANTLRTSQSGLGAFFRRVQSRGGKAKAVTATAHRLARLVYALLTRGGAYVAQSQEEYERAYQERQVRHLQKKARQLGYELTAAANQAAAGTQ